MSKPKMEIVLPILQGLLASGRYVTFGQNAETKNEKAVEAVNDATMIAAMVDGVVSGAG